MRANQFCPPDKAEKFATNPGNKFHKLYAPKVSENGTLELVEAGVENTDDIIQSQCESTDIRTLIARVNAGDVDALNVHRGMFGDFTKMPKTYAELLQNQINAKNAFDRLPVDIKKKFDNDVNKFLAQSGTEEWNKALGLTDEMRSMNNNDSVDASVDTPASTVEEK